ncbi:hypothetical protein KSS87_003203 [Heliosperma pusillum]|nr:hypothetical protein KSS87_003203 [Heliosperma pusillum]
MLLKEERWSRLLQVVVSLCPSSFQGGEAFMKENYLDAMTICKWFGYPDLFITFTCNPKWPEITRFVTKRGMRAEDRPDIISDPVEDHVLHVVVCAHMLHGPCGTAKQDSPCMVGGRCSKYYPKECTERTTVDKDGYPIYKRRKNRVVVFKDGVPMSNGSVIPYNPQLLFKYRAHINVEWCNQSRAIKYLFNYINKGPDRVTMQSSYSRSNDQDPGLLDEIKRYYDCRYISACEAVWRIFGFHIHYKSPSVERLHYHLSGEQPVVFDDDTFIDDVLMKSYVGVSQFLNWMSCNIREVLPNNCEDRDMQIAKQLLFSQFLTKFVWKKKQQQWTLRKKKGLKLEECETKLGVFYLTTSFIGSIESLTIKINGSSLNRFERMPLPDISATSHHRNNLVMDELSYDRQSLREEHDNNLAIMTDEQRLVYNEIVDVVLKNKGGVFFVYGHGGTGKTFIWRTLCAAFRCKGDIVLPVASSGIAATLIPGGRTAHSRFGIPLSVTENSTCPRIKPGSDFTKLLRRAKLIIWDEAPMTHKHSFEALDRSLKRCNACCRREECRRTFWRKSGSLWGGGEDFRQILPVVLKGSRADIVHASLCSSYLWSSYKVLKLTKNMRLQVGSSSNNGDAIKKFSEWILEIGNGLAGGDNTGEVELQFPLDLLIEDVSDPIASLVNVTYPSLQSQLWNPDYLQERAILAPTHEIVDEVNDYVLSLIDKDERIYLSSDEVSKDGTSIGERDLHATKILNRIKCSGLPNHQLCLKIGAMVMLLRNIDQSRGLCNDTRQLWERVLLGVRF